MNTIDRQYEDLLADILKHGVEKKDRTGVGTLSVFGRQIRYDLNNGFPRITTKFVPMKAVKGELLWFLSGDTNIKWLRTMASLSGMSGPMWTAPRARVWTPVAFLACAGREGHRPNLRGRRER